MFAPFSVRVACCEKVFLGQNSSYKYATISNCIRRSKIQLCHVNSTLSPTKRSHRPQGFNLEAFGHMLSKHRSTYEQKRLVSY